MGIDGAGEFWGPNRINRSYWIYKGIDGTNGDERWPQRLTGATGFARCIAGINGVDGAVVQGSIGLAEGLLVTRGVVNGIGGCWRRLLVPQGL
jgi:hypothetical protein